MGRPKGSRNKPVATPEAIGHCFDCGRPSVTLVCDDCDRKARRIEAPAPRTSFQQQADRRWNGVGYAPSGAELE